MATATENQLPTQGRFFNVLQRGYRTRVYRPARYYLTWYFLASLAAAILFLVNGVYSYLDGGITMLENHMAVNGGGFLASLFLCILSTYNGMTASSLHLLEGDRGFYSLGSVPATAAIITKSTFICTTPEQKALYNSKYHGCRITRFYVWRWGRKGGCQNWPGKAGGKSEGFWAAVTYSWEQAEKLDPVTGASTGDIEVLEQQPCPRCNRDNGNAKTDEGKKWLGYVHIPALSSSDLQKMSQDTPGNKRGGVIVLPMQVMADRYLDELPYALADAIQHDEEFRATSRVDVMYDPLPEGDSIGTVMSHNAEIEMFGLQATSKRSRKQSVDLHQTIAVLGQLRGPLGGTGQP